MWNIHSNASLRCKSNGVPLHAVSTNLAQGEVEGAASPVMQGHFSKSGRSTDALNRRATKLFGEGGDPDPKRITLLDHGCRGHRHRTDNGSMSPNRNGE